MEDWESAKGSRPKHNMRTHYTDGRALASMTWSHGLPCVGNDIWFACNLAHLPQNVQRMSEGLPPLLYTRWLLHCCVQDA
eukprot:scaffold24563_cov43-Cyclotella_meneghiniana.AAC.4